MWAYVDESGNTGARVFDPEQPVLTTCALVTKTNFDLTRAHAVAAIAKKASVDALHANELGAGRIEGIADDLRLLLKGVDARFFMARVEKRYLAACKVFDVYFDAGENLAVPWHAYWLKPMRLTLLFRIATEILTEEIAQAVWDCVTAKSERRSRELFMAGARALLERAPRLMDARVRQIVTEALEWALANPEEFTTHMSDKRFRNNHSPNFVAFTNLLAGLEGFSQKWGRPIREIVHDRQSEFERSFQTWHGLVSRPELADAAPVEWPGEPEPIRFGKAAGSVMRMADEQSSPGLQVVDVVLWLFKRALDGRDIGPCSSRLLDHVFRHALQSDFSFRGVGKSADDRLREIMSSAPAQNLAKAGFGAFGEIEARRRAQLAEHAERKRREMEPAPVGGAAIPNTRSPRQD